MEEFDDDDEGATRGPLHGEDSFCAVRFTGAGTLEAVKFVSRPEAMNTGPPPSADCRCIRCREGHVVLCVERAGDVAG